MPNWAISNVTVHSTDIEGLKHLNDVICTPENYATIPEDCDRDWIGSVLLGLGISEGDAYDIASREFIQDCELDGENLTLYVQSAWGLHYRGLQTMCDKALTDYTIAYTCEEPGAGYFVTNIKEESKKYYVSDDGEIEYFTKEVLEDICIPEWNEKYGKNWKTVSDVINDLEDIETLYISPFEYVPFNELSE